LVESIGGIDGTPPTLDVQSLHMHGFIGAKSLVVTSNLVVIVVISNFVTITLNFVKV
jgi:hypothetical protein